MPQPLGAPERRHHLAERVTTEPDHVEPLVGVEVLQVRGQVELEELDPRVRMRSRVVVEDRSDEDAALR